MSSRVIEEAVLIDTGPLVASMNRNDADHMQCVEVFRALPLGKSFTCWPVLTETAYLMRARLSLRDPSLLFDLVSNRELELAPLHFHDLTGMLDTFRKYHDQQVDLADAALLQLAERLDIGAIFTTDRRHFRLYTRSNGAPFRLLPDDFDG